jgi:two-component system vancomycin resistance associated response regulator VraR
MAGERIFPDTTPTLNIGAALSVEFTESELKVLRLVVAGERDQDIAEELGVSINTVRTHLRVMMDKTGIRSRTALAVRVRDAGFVIVEPKEDEI